MQQTNRVKKARWILQIRGRVKIIIYIIRRRDWEGVKIRDGKFIMNEKNNGGIKYE
jgi:hypothetical protein